MSRAAGGAGPMHPTNRFCDYLRRKGRVSEVDLRRARTLAGTLNLKTGLCAVAFGFLDEEQVHTVLGVQNRTRQKFGEIAVGMGLLSPGQRNTILRIQDKYRVALEDALVLGGALTGEELAAEKRLFEESSKDEGRGSGKDHLGSKE